MPNSLIRHRMDNGLSVIVEETHMAPSIGVNLSYDVGSRHEEPGRTGLARLFERLFQGSEHFGLLHAVGADLNAATSFDRTMYFETVPSNALDLTLWLEADRMGGLLGALDQSSLDNQRDVIKNGRRQRCDNVPHDTAMERPLAALFPVDHPYHDVIGSMADLDAASLDDVRAFFPRFYAPSNAYLSSVGDVARTTCWRRWIPVSGASHPPYTGRALTSWPRRSSDPPIG